LKTSILQDTFFPGYYARNIPGYLRDFPGKMNVSGKLLGNPSILQNLCTSFPLERHINIFEKRKNIYIASNDINFML